MTAPLTLAQRELSQATRLRKRARVLQDLADVKRRLAAQHLQQADTMEANVGRLVQAAVQLEER